MLIKYKPEFDHIKTVPVIPNAADPKSYDRSIIQLLPGTNEVSEDEWNAIKPHISAEIKSGEIAPLNVPATEGKTPDGKARSLKDVPARLAREIVEKCVNPITLKKWFREETRDEVVLAVVKRMRKLKLDPDEIEKENGKARGSELDGSLNPEGGADETRADGNSETGKKRGKKDNGGKKDKGAGKKEKNPPAGDDEGTDEGGGNPEGDADDFSGFDDEE